MTGQDALEFSEHPFAFVAIFGLAGQIGVPGIGEGDRAACSPCDRLQPSVCKEAVELRLDALAEQVLVLVVALLESGFVAEAKEPRGPSDANKMRSRRKSSTAIWGTVRSSLSVSDSTMPCSFCRRKGHNRATCLRRQIERVAALEKLKHEKELLIQIKQKAAEHKRDEEKGLSKSLSAGAV